MKQNIVNAFGSLLEVVAIVWRAAKILGIRMSNFQETAKMPGAVHYFFVFVLTKKFCFLLLWNNLLNAEWNSLQARPERIL